MAIQLAFSAFALCTWCSSTVFLTTWLPTSWSCRTCIEYQNHASDCMLALQMMRTLFIKIAVHILDTCWFSFLQAYNGKVRDKADCLMDNMQMQRLLQSYESVLQAMFSAVSPALQREQRNLEDHNIDVEVLAAALRSDLQRFKSDLITNSGLSSHSLSA